MSRTANTSRIVSGLIDQSKYWRIGFLADLRFFLDTVTLLTARHSYCIRIRPPETRLCTAQVKLAYLFGSQATGKTGPLSDVDVSVHLKEKDKEKEKREFQPMLQCVGTEFHLVLLAQLGLL